MQKKRIYVYKGLSKRLDSRKRVPDLYRIRGESVKKKRGTSTISVAFYVKKGVHGVSAGKGGNRERVRKGSESSPSL